jgi:hypothetical protein
MAHRNAIWKEQWETAGLADAHGSMSRRVPHGDVFVPPTIKVSDSHLHWSMEPLKRPPYVTPTKKTFDGFIKLWNRSDAEIVTFAQKWGILQYDPADGPSKGTESIHMWRELSRRACAVANIAADLRSGGRGPQADWEILGAIGEPPENRILPNRSISELITEPSGFRWGARIGVERLKDQLAGEVSQWLRTFAVGFALEARHASWELTLHYRGSLAAAMALQLAVMVSDSDLFICSACHFPYVRSRNLKRPSPGQNNYCPDCQPRRSRVNVRGAGQRKAEESYRLRKRVKRMLSQGHKVSDIAADTQKSVDVIRRLLRSGK